MFFVLLKFSSNKTLAPEFMQAHKDWIKQGFDDGVFLSVGSLKPNSDSEIGGGAILAHNTSYQDLQSRIKRDPFVIEGIVSATIIEVSPNQADERLKFLLD